MEHQESFEKPEEKDLSRQFKVQLPPFDDDGSHGFIPPQRIASGLPPRGVSLFRAKLEIPLGVPFERPTFDSAIQYLILFASSCYSSAMQATFLNNDFEQGQKHVAEIRARLTDIEDRLTDWENGRKQQIERANR